MSCQLNEGDDNDNIMITPPDPVLVDVVQEAQAWLLAAIDVLLGIVGLGDLQMTCEEKINIIQNNLCLRKYLGIFI